MSETHREENRRLKNQLTGKGFELAVASQLLLRGLVCNLGLVDAGVDMVTWSRKGMKLNIQVKGRNFRGHGTGVESAEFSANSYHDPDTKPDFAIIPLRYLMGSETDASYGRTSYLILSHSSLEELKRDGYFSQTGQKLKLQLNVEFDNATGVPNRVLLQGSYGARGEGKDVTKFLNLWHEIEAA